MKNKVYVVTMYRWGDRERHSYLLGVYSTKTKAEKAALVEKEYRGGSKYYPECLEVEIDPKERLEWKVMMPLESNPNLARVRAW